MNCRRQRDCVPLPRLKNELSWVNVPQTRQPQRGCVHSVRWNPHVQRGCDATPLELEIISAVVPRVARASQSWALCPNPVGILHGECGRVHGKEAGK